MDISETEYRALQDYDNARDREENTVRQLEQAHNRIHELEGQLRQIVTDPAAWLRERANSYNLDVCRLAESEPDEALDYRIIRDELYACAEALETDMKTVDRIKQDMGE